MAQPELVANSPNIGQDAPLTTLASALASGALAMSVAAPAPASLQGTGQVRLILDGEVILVDAASTSTTNWVILQRQVEGTSQPASHAVGTQVWHKPTVGMLDMRYARRGLGSIYRIDVCGHSCPAAGGTAGGDQNGYVDRLAKMLGAYKRANISTGGATACWQSNNATGDGGWSWVLNNFTPPNSGDGAGGYQPNTTVAVVHHGYEDLAALGSTRPTPAQKALETECSRYCTAALFEDSDASWTWGTAMSVAAPGSSWTYSGGGSHYCQWSGAFNAQQFGQWACPSDYPGNEVIAIGLTLVGSTSALGTGNSITVALTIDGTEYDVTIPLDTSAGGWVDDENSKNNGIVLRFGRSDCGLGLPPAQGGLSIPALAAGAHTINVALKSAITSGTFFIVDYAQIEADPLNGPVIVVPGSWRPLAAGQTTWNTWAHGYNAATDPMTDAKIGTWNTALWNYLAQQFPKRFVSADIDAPVLNQNSAFFSSDGIHPSNQGHAMIAEYIFGLLSSSGLVTDRVRSRTSKRSVGGGYYDGGVWRPIGGQFGTSIGLPLQNSWTPYGGGVTPAYTKTLDGKVKTRGWLKGGTSANAVMMTLGAAYSPTVVWDRPAVTYTGAAFTTGFARFDTNGNFYMLAGGQIAAGSLNNIEHEHPGEGGG